MDERFGSDRVNVRLLLLVAAGSAAAGVHAGLAPEHLREWLPLGASFVAAAAASGLAVAAVAVRPRGVWAARTLVLVLTGLIGAYLLTRLVALPPLDPEQEGLDPIGLLTVLAEAAGALAALPLVLGQGGTR